MISCFIIANLLAVIIVVLVTVLTLDREFTRQSRINTELEKRIAYLERQVDELRGK